MKGFLYWSAYNKICETIHMDAACGRIMNGDANGCGNSLAKASRNANATPDDFVCAVRQFLSTADARSCTLTPYDPTYTDFEFGFTTRRLDKFLYVDSVNQETRLAPGMRIVAVGKNTIPTIADDISQEIFWGRNTDREDWDLAFRMYDDIDVFPGDGHVIRIDLKHYPIQKIPPRIKLYRKGKAAVMELNTLSDSALIEAALEEHGDVLSGAEVFVCDLRRCAGQADPDSWLLLLPRLVDHDMAARDVFGDRKVYSIYSKNNAELLAAPLRAALDTLEAQDAQMVQELISDIEAKAAQVLEAKRQTRGMRQRREVSELEEVVPSVFEDEAVSVAGDAPASAHLLVGPKTGIGAERLAEAVMGQEKVKLFGQATPGVVDYDNYLTLDLDEVLMRFTYPMSRTALNKQGQGYARRGLPLDVHIPFEARMCTEDITLEKACE